MENAFELNIVKDDKDSNENTEEYITLHQTPTLLDQSASINNKESFNIVEEKEETIYLNPINAIHPRKLGNTYAYIYINNRPLITIGPDCKR